MVDRMRPLWGVCEHILQTTVALCEGCVRKKLTLARGAKRTKSQLQWNPYPYVKVLHLLW